MAAQQTRRAVALAALTAALALGGCASAPPAASGAAAGGGITADAAATTPGDPWERWNRKVYAFNDAIDKAVLKPVAQTYRDVVPSMVRTGVSNVLGNIGDVWSAANQLLQGKLQYGVEMGMRVVTNTLMGLGGLLDPATEFGLIKRPEDFGQTLGRWGVGTGPYMVLPLLGPSTLRDTAALPLDLSVSPSALPPTTGGKVGVSTISLVDQRTKLLSTGDLVDQVALDRYSFIRDAYIARRRDAVYDGAPPMETFDDEPADAAAAPATPGSAASGAAASGSTLARPAAPAASGASAPAR